MRDTDYMDIFDRSMDTPPVSQEEGLRILRELGLELTPQPETDMPWTYAQALGAVGMGVFDDNTETWTPSSCQFYAFDAEVFNMEHMYLYYFQGLQSISQGELTFSDVLQDNSKVDWETPGGTVTVHLRLNGMACTYHMEFQGDWLDTRVQKAVNQTLEKLGIQKRFYSTGINQGSLVFFCTEAWARAFEEATLCYMDYDG